MPRRQRTPLFLLLAVIMIAGCDAKSGPAPEKGSANPPAPAASSSGEVAPPSEGASEAIAPPTPSPRVEPPSAAALEASAQALDIDLAAWQASRAPEGNFASLSVPGEAGAQEPLSVESLAVSVTIEGRMARTEVTQVFRNHLSRQTEGTYEFVLPAGAAISRLAMDVEGKMMEGELVERERARLIYEGIVRQQKDPALLEWQGGERFQTQIFPIPASGTKTVVLTYEELMPEDASGLTYRYSLPNFEKQSDGEIGEFDFRLDVMSARSFEMRGYQADITKNPQSTHATLSRKNFVPQGPLEVAFGARARGDRSVYTGARAFDSETQQFFMIDYTPTLPAVSAAAVAKNYVFAIDTSAGLGDAVVDQSALATLLLIDGLGDDARFNIVHGDFRVEACADAPLSKAERQAAVDCLKALDAGGATDLGALLTTATQAAAAMEGPTSVVLFSDGVASLGELDGELIRAQTIEALSSKQIALHAVAVGHAPAEAELKALARATRGHTARMAPTSPPHHVTRHLVDRLHEPLLTDLRVEVVAGSVEHMTPSTPLNLARGEALSVLGRLESPEATIVVSGDHAGQRIEQRFTVTPAASPEPSMLSNFWARAAIDVMEGEGLHRGEVSAHSLKYGVMSRYTSFLVLENDAAYERFNVDRRQQAQRDLEQLEEKKTAQNLKKGEEDLQALIAAGDGAKAEAKKEAMEPARQRESKPRPPPRAFDGQSEMEDPSSGSFGLGGEGEGGGGGMGGSLTGKGSGSGGYNRVELGERSPRTPRLKPGRPAVSGNFDKKIIRRVVARSKRQIKSCYEGELRKNPGLEGRIVVQWRISPTGDVSLAAIAENSMGNAAVANCLVEVVKKWRFPAPQGGGSVNVKYPFAFDSGSSGIPQPTLAERTADLESRRETLQPWEIRALVSIYLTDGNKDAAKAIINEAGMRFGGVGLVDDGRGHFEIFQDATIRAEFPDVFRAATIFYFDTRVAKDPTNSLPLALSRALVDVLIAGAEWDTLPATFAKGIHSIDVIHQMISRLVAAKKLDVARALITAVEARQGIEAFELMLDDPTLRDAFGDDIFQLSARLLKKRPADHAVLNRHVALGQTLGRTAEVEGLIEQRCTESTLTYSQCNALLNLLTNAEAVRARVIDTRLKNMRQIRSRDVSNPTLIMEFVAMLRAKGSHDDADRLMSELVEFTPHDFNARLRYGHEFKALERPVEACEAYSKGVQISPAERDTFRTMMSLRRDFPDANKGLRDCIVQGVSNLPVKRDVSLIMTWEDPTADVDMHIREATGEAINYTHRESQQGGLLYYDITDGFGPEIYVLGNGKKGEYVLEVVYYSGSTENIKGSLTILRNAGAPDEQREHIEFVLPKANNSKKIPLGTVSL